MERFDNDDDNDEEDDEKGWSENRSFVVRGHAYHNKM